ncbi:MAG: hypothetical protein Q9219_006214 [cf. Caloplaca sp. 3 TL-2023]
MSSRHHDPSSSVNSADVESHYATPETKLTTLSPEDMHSSKGNSTHAILESNEPPAFLLGAVPTKGGSKRKGTKSTAAGNQDPFVTINSSSTAVGSSEPPKLSAVAAPFKPSSFAQVVGGVVVPHTLTLPIKAPAGIYTYSPSSLLSTPIMPETPYGQVSLEGYLSPAATGTHPSQSSQTSPISIRSPQMEHAIEAFEALHKLRRDWLIQYLPASSHTQDNHCLSLSSSTYEGQLFVRAEFAGPPMYFDLGTVSRLVLDLLNNYGSVMAYDALITVYPVVAYRAEFFDTKDANHAMDHLNGFRIAVRVILPL